MKNIFDRYNTKIGLKISALFIIFILIISLITSPISSYFSDVINGANISFSISFPLTGPGASAPAGGTFTDNGIIWRVLVDNSKTDRTKLIITENVYNFGYISYYTSNYYLVFESSNLKNNVNYGMDKWFGANASNDLKAIAVPYAYKPGFNGNENNAVTTGAWNANAMDPNALTIPDLAGTSGHGYPFALSISECNSYKAMFANGSFLANDTIGNRVWWLRSPGSGTTYSASYVGSGGGIANGAANSTAAGMRVAVWIKL